MASLEGEESKMGGEEGHDGSEVADSSSHAATPPASGTPSIRVLENLKEKLDSHLRELPVLGFNSGTFNKAFPRREFYEYDHHPSSSK